jgi:integrase
MPGCAKPRLFSAGRRLQSFNLLQVRGAVPAHPLDEFGSRHLAFVGRAWSSKQKYRDYLNLYILPRWGTVRLVEVKTIAVEAWLRTLMVTKGSRKAPRKEAMADATKQSVRNTFSVLFTHAQRYEFVPVGYNSIKLVRQSGKRQGVPEVLTPSEIHGLWHGSGTRERAMIAIAYGNGPRISEVMGLKWQDIDFTKGVASVNKSVVKGHLGENKTEASKMVVPLQHFRLVDLRAWREVASYPGDDAYVFASHRNKGRRPYWPDTILAKHIRPLAKKLGITKCIGWHTFRRTFSSLLIDHKEDVKVVQELMRHSSPNTTLRLYAQASSERLRDAQSRVIETIRNAPLPSPVDAQNQPETHIVHNVPEGEPTDRCN